MAKIEWTDEARFWLQEIYEYIAKDNEEAAWQVVLGIYDRVQTLRQFPESGQRFGKYPDKNIRILLMVITASPTRFGMKTRFTF